MTMNRGAGDLMFSGEIQTESRIVSGDPSPRTELCVCVEGPAKTYCCRPSVEGPTKTYCCSPIGRFYPPCRRRIGRCDPPVPPATDSRIQGARPKRTSRLPSFSRSGGSRWAKMASREARFLLRATAAPPRTGGTAAAGPSSPRAGTSSGAARPDGSGTLP